MTSEEILQALERYRFNLVEIMGRFVHGHNSYRIRREDDPSYRTFIIEIIDLLTDAMGDNKYSTMIAKKFAEGTYNQLQTPSYKSIEDIVSIIDSVVTRLKRNPDFYVKKEEPKTETPKEQDITKQESNTESNRTIDRADLTIIDLLFSSNYKVKILVVLVFLSGFGIGVGLGASKLYKEKIAPLIDLYKTQDTPKK